MYPRGFRSLSRAGRRTWPPAPAPPRSADAPGHGLGGGLLGSAGLVGRLGAEGGLRPRRRRRRLRRRRGPARWMARRVGRFGWWPILAYPVSMLAFVGLFAWSVVRTHVLGSVTWRGGASPSAASGREPARSAPPSPSTPPPGARSRSAPATSCTACPTRRSPPTAACCASDRGSGAGASTGTGWRWRAGSTACPRAGRCSGAGSTSGPCRERASRAPRALPARDPPGRARPLAGPGAVAAVRAVEPARPLAGDGGLRRRRERSVHRGAALQPIAPLPRAGGARERLAAVGRARPRSSAGTSGSSIPYGSPP